MKIVNNYYQLICEKCNKLALIPISKKEKKEDRSAEFRLNISKIGYTIKSGNTYCQECKKWKI